MMQVVMVRVYMYAALGQPYRIYLSETLTILLGSILPTELRLSQVKQKCAFMIFRRLDQLHRSPSLRACRG